MKNNKLFIYSLFFLIIFSCSKKNHTTQDLISNISTEELKKHVYKLADDEFEGRGAGYKGEKAAAIYIADNFKTKGLLTLGSNEDYFQKFNFHTLDSNPWEILQTQNVLGVLKGDKYPDEYIVVGGHHDGQGMEGQALLGRNTPEGIVTDSITASKDLIWNSAVDNAVSISAIIEMARVLSNTNIKLKRSIIFTTFSAEESGLDGSAYFVNNPPVPLRQIKAMVNLEKIVGDPGAEFLYVSYGTNPIFEHLRKEIDSLQEINLTSFYSGMIANTDHYAFAQRKIPTITIGTGSSINIHTPLDHANRLDYDLFKKRTQYILHYLIELTNSESSFEFTGDLSGLMGVSGGPASKLEKKQKDFDGNVAFKVTTVVKDSKGYIAGLRAGDLIIGIENDLVKYKKFYQGLEDVIGETDKKEIILKVIRNNKKIELVISLK
ncbi:M28 family peptidase [Olleya sp. AH-315-F22]|nr:M28 family peptidase [Olleya sp. AH-315-F22]